MHFGKGIINYGILTDKIDINSNNVVYKNWNITESSDSIIQEDSTSNIVEDDNSNNEEDLIMKK